MILKRDERLDKTFGLSLTMAEIYPGEKQCRKECSLPDSHTVLHCMPVNWLQLTRVDVTVLKGRNERSLCFGV